MDRTIVIDGKTVTLRATALVPRLYRHLIGRDIIRDIATLKKSYSAALEVQADEENRDAAAMTEMDLEIFENVAWVMLKHAAEFREVDGERVLMNGDMMVGRSPDEWLERMDGVFSVYDVLPVILELWGANQQTTSAPAKK